MASLSPSKRQLGSFGESHPVNDAAANRMFIEVGRQRFREYFQPSRILLGLWPCDNASGVNVITLCFSMYCSYDPPMIACSIYRDATTYGLAADADTYVLAVPGESLASVALACGTMAGRNVDKVSELGMRLMPSLTIPTPGLLSAIANVELRTVSRVVTGDHLTVIGQVLRFRVNANCDEKPLVSFGPREAGFLLLARGGIHRIGIVKDKADSHQT
jgi:flavin reductase (DIM6/NTAB) family NADH-FMN oxidoreductase RutF